MKYLKDTERSKDLVMECFADLPTLIDRHEVHALRGWLHTVVRNRCLMLLRQATPHTRNADQLPLQDDNTDEQLLLEEGLENLERAMAQLNPAQHDCVRLFHLERLSYTEVAERTGLRVEQVRSHLQNGRRNLRSILDRRTPNHDH